MKMQEYYSNANVCRSPPTTPGTYSVGPVTPNTPCESDGKFYQEIATEMVGNALIIRVEKDKNKSRNRMRGRWDPPCDCDMVEIRRPSSNNESAKIINGGDSNQVLFKVFSNSQIPKDDANYKPQTIAYKVGACRGGPHSNDQCRTITVEPRLGGPGSQEVHSDHIQEGNRDVFLLRIKKKGDTLDPKQRNIELELRTPLPPCPPTASAELTTPENIIAENQSASTIIDDKKKKKGKREKAKGKSN